MEQFINEVSLCVARQNGINLSDLFSIKGQNSMKGHNSVKGLNYGFLLEYEQMDAMDIQQLVRSSKLPQGEDGSLWIELIAKHLLVLKNFHKNQIESSFIDQVVVVQTLQRLFMSSTRWILPLIYKVNEDLWLLARELPEEYQQESARIINKSLTICLTDRSSLGDSRKWGSYRMTGLLFRVYFHLGQLNLCGNVLRALGAADLPNNLRYPASHLVTFRYFLGRLYFVNEDYVRSEAELNLAFVHCPKSSIHNKKLILHYLIPVRLLLKDIHPSRELLQRYDLLNGFYGPIISAIRKGDLQTFMLLLSNNAESLLELGTFLVWEKLQLLVFKNLIKRIYFINGSQSRMSLELLIGPLKFMKLEMEIDEIACFVANCIDKGMIKGYISQEKNVIVLSQKDPFPPFNK